MKSEKGAGILLSYLHVTVEAFVGIVLTVIMTNHLGQGGYGLYKLALSWVSVISVIDLGLGGTICRYTVKYRTEGDVEGERKFIGIAFAVYLFLSLIVVVVGTLMSLFLPLLVNDIQGGQVTEFRTIFLLLIVKTSIVLFNHAFIGRFSAIERFVYIKSVAIFYTAFRFILTIVFLPFMPSPVFVAAIDLMLVFLQLLCNINASRKFGFERIKFYGYDKTLFCELFSFTASIFVASIINQFNSNVDNIVLGIFCSTTIVGLYSSVMQIYTIFSELSTAIQGVFLSHVSKSVFENKSDDEITCTMVTPSRMQIVILMLALTGFIHFGDDFMRIWIGDVYDSVQLFNAHIVGIIIMASASWQLFQNSATNILKAKNILRGKVVITGVATIVNFILTLVLVPRFNMIGAAIGTAFSMIFGYGVATNIYYSKVARINLKLYYSETFCGLGYVIPSVFLVGFVVDLIPGKSVPIFLTKIVCYVVIYIVAIFVLGFKKSEKQLIKNRLYKKNNNNHNHNCSDI